MDALSGDIELQDINSQPLVSIVTSCYNHEAYIEDYLSGLLVQTYRNIELVLFDDGSTDGSWEIICSYQLRLRAAFPKVICERHDNVGVYNEISQAIERATGEYLCILDSDDYYLPTKIEENVRYLESHPEAGLVHSDFFFLRDGLVSPGGYRATKNQIVPTGEVLERLIEGNFVNTASACCRTELVKRFADFRSFASRGYTMGDYPLWLRIALNSEVGYIPKALCCYRVLAESASRSKCPIRRYRIAKATDQVKLDFIKEYDIDLPVVRKVLRERHITLFYGGYTLLQKDDYLEGYRWLAENYPAEFANWKQRLRLQLVRNQRLWKAVRRIEDTKLMRRLFGENQIAP